MPLTLSDDDVIHIIEKCPTFIIFVPIPTTEMKMVCVKSFSRRKNDCELNDVLPETNIIIQIALSKLHWPFEYVYFDNINLEAQLLFFKYHNESTLYINPKNGITQLAAVKRNIKNIINIKTPYRETQIYVAKALVSMGRLVLKSMEKRYPLMFAKLWHFEAVQILELLS